MRRIKVEISPQTKPLRHIFHRSAWAGARALGAKDTTGLPKARCLRQPTRGDVVSTDQREVLPSFRWNGGATSIRHFHPGPPMLFASPIYRRTERLGLGA